jgi:hypothetical protein
MQLAQPSVGLLLSVDTFYKQARGIVSKILSFCFKKIKTFWHCFCSSIVSNHKTRGDIDVQENSADRPG